MASINWLKLTAQKAQGMTVHFDTEARKTHTHANAHIDRTRTCENYSIGAENYREALNRLKKRTKEADEIQPPKRVRKDRITACLLEYTCPPELTEKGLTGAFFETMHELLTEYFGAENIHGTFIHADEQHTYRDAETHEKRVSLIHAHTLLSTYTKEHGINGKHFETRARLLELDRLTNYVLERRFGIKYRTGQGKNMETVETLKAKSEQYEQGRKDALKDVQRALDRLSESTVSDFVQAWKEEQKAKKQKAKDVSAPER